MEHEIDKTLGIKKKEDVYALGVKKWEEEKKELETKGQKVETPSEHLLWNKAIREYNKACRSIVMRYSHEWEERVERLGSD